jgi:hypothetical protein
MINRIAWLVLAAALCAPALWAQSEGTGGAAAGAGATGAAGTSSEDEFFGSSEVEAKPGTA